MALLLCIVFGAIYCPHSVLQHSPGQFGIKEGDARVNPDVLSQECRVAAMKKILRKEKTAQNESHTWSQKTWPQ